MTGQSGHHRTPKGRPCLNKISEVGVVKRGRGRPLTLFAPGGHGENLDIRMQEADRVPGTKIGFA